MVKAERKKAEAGRWRKASKPNIRWRLNLTVGRRQLELTSVASSGSLAASGGPTKPPLSSARLVQISG